MLKRRLLAIILLSIWTLAPVLWGQDKAAPSAGRTDLTLNADEAEAVLEIIGKHSAGKEVAQSEWQKLFDTEPYIRLKKREAAMHRDFTDDDFKKFVLSPELGAKASALRQTLDSWRSMDLTASARRVLTYLPDQAHIKAKVFPMIKPKTNSFVFDTDTDPAIFLYLDPEESAPKFENTVAHELHHIGFSSVESLRNEKLKDLPPHLKTAIDWMGAFGEGFVMLAAAGGPDVDPHATSSPEERTRWEHDMAGFNQDLGALQEFFLDVINGRLATKEQVDEKAYSFFGVQGPWYTVGYKMAVMIEKRYGRKQLIACMLDPRELLASYDRAAEEANKRGTAKLALWSPELTGKIGIRLGN